MIEAELFGHVRGAFTSAHASRAGLIEAAEDGTLFLDEIGDMPADAQTRLLRVLQQGEYSSVGGRAPIKANVRIIGATNQDLRQLIRQGLFREDLFYRLNVVPMRLPPLRERTEDVPDLARHFLAQAEASGLPTKRISRDALECLRTYQWPGNVRELENLIQRLVALYPEDVIEKSVVEAEIQPAATSLSGTVAPDGDGDRNQAGGDNIGASVEQHLARYFQAHGESLPPAGLYDRVVREVERPLIQLCLAATRGNQIRASELLGLNRNTLRKKIKELEIQVVRGVN